tara:strand:+ start:266 stop:1198 length:933 start_codon:yes stop_codon:yes gene_type:complete
MNKKYLIYKLAKMTKKRVKLNRLPLTALRTFEAAARLLSFKDAADELHVSATTVSNQIRKLEKDWDCKLFIRKTRSVVLTDTGRSLSTVVSKSFGQIRREIETHISDTKRALKVAIGPIFGRWIIPKINGFQKRYPEIDLIIENSPRITNAEMMTSDIQIDWGEPDSWFGLESTFLMEVTYSPVLSPKILKNIEFPKTSEDLINLTLIHQYDYSEWAAWMRLNGSSELDVESGIIIVDSNVALQAAIDGAGVALGSFPFVAPELASGILVKPFDIDLVPSRSYYVLVKPQTTPNPDISIFVAWLKEQVSN